MIEEIVVAKAWPTMNTNQRRDGGFEVAEYAMIGLEGFAGGGVGEWGEAVVGTFERSRGHYGDDELEQF